MGRPKLYRKCSRAECDRPHYGRGFCHSHWSQWKKTGETWVLGERSVQNGWLNQEGYRVLRVPADHPMATSDNKVLEHRLVMSEILGRPLRSGENVHHINGVRHDNRPENLELWITKQPLGQRVQDKVAWAREILAQYGDLVPEVIE